MERSGDRKEIPASLWWTLLSLPLLVYCALPTRNYYWDGVAIAINVERHPPVAQLVYPSHLIYALWGTWLSQGTGRALFAMQAANCVLAGLSVILLGVYLRRINVPATLSLAWALVFAFSATWWRFATDANAYVPSIFLLLCACVLLEGPRRASALAAGLATAGAMCFHELAILFVLVALVRLNRDRRSLSIFLVAAILPVLAGYLFSFWTVAQAPTLTGLFSWVTAHSADSYFRFNPFADLALSLRGSLRLFFGGKPSDFVGNWISVVAITLLPVALVMFGVCCWQAVREHAKAQPPSREMLLWAGVSLAFLFFWMPQNTFYRLFYLPPLILIPAVMLRHAPAITRTAVWLFVPVLFLWNFSLVAYPQSRPEFNAPLRFALTQEKSWPAGTPIVFHTFHPDLWTISYFNPQVVWMGMARPNLDQLNRDLREARAHGKTLWLEETAYASIAASPDGQRWLVQHDLPGGVLEYRDEKHDFRFHRVS